MTFLANPQQLLSGNRAVTERIKPVFMGTENENQNRHLNLSNTICWSGI
jgi:hypothetical protein